MDIFLIDPSLTMKEDKIATQFAKKVREEVEKYTKISLVTQSNIARYKIEITKDLLIIVFNDTENADIEESCVSKFLREAKERNALIWPVSMRKDQRTPMKVISTMQCYDVEEQLRARNLSEEYLESIAKIFSRKIISKVMPTIYNEHGTIFVSHRRLDGEEITAKLCDKIKIQSKETNTFRDVVNVQVGENAQEVIDDVMSESDAFIFIHTEQSSKSQWILKELNYAIMNNIPILWVQIDNADKNKLEIHVPDEPHLTYNSLEFNDEKRLTEIVDEILNYVFKIILNGNTKVFDYLGSIQSLFGEAMSTNSETDMLYTISIPRKNYHYPQRDIKQYVQLFGRTPIKSDWNRIQELIDKEESTYDSAVILTDKIVKSKSCGKIVEDSMDDFYYHWNNYLKGAKEDKNMEIVISGAFPKADKIYKQTLINALVVFGKTILKEGYVLTFGSHPTFQKLFFEISKEVCPKDRNTKLKMYISKHFENSYKDEKESLESNAQLIEVEKVEVENNELESRNKSLTKMRECMIQRKEVAALICLGGKIKSNEKEEGIREEIKLAQEFDIPVFIVGSVGGASSKVALEFKKKQWEGLNKASSNLNQKFMDSLDYFLLSQELMKYLEENQRG